MGRSRRTRNKTKMRGGKNARKIKMRGGKNARKTKMRGGKNARKTRMRRRKYVMRGGSFLLGNYAYVNSGDPEHKVKVYDVNDPDTQIRDPIFVERQPLEMPSRQYRGGEYIELENGYIVYKLTISF